MSQTKILIVGAGASGCMAGVKSAELGYDVTIFDKNEKIGRKMLITGKGRCNVTNNCDNNTLMSSVVSNPKFLYSAFSAFSTKDTMDFFQNNGVPLKTERGNRVFPQSDKSTDIIDVFFFFFREHHVTIKNEVVTGLIIENNKICGVTTNNKKEYFADKVILCCGGASYPQTGSDGSGYELAKSAGHTIVEPAPSLVPIVTKQKWCGELQGLSLRNVTVTVKQIGEKKDKIILSEQGEMLFTHYGVTGPLVLSASSHIDIRKNFGYKLIIDLKPALSEEQLDKRILRDFGKFINKDLINSLDELLPKALIPVVISESNIDKHKKCNEITKQERTSLVNTIKNLTVDFQEFRPIAEAIVTRGGVSVKEIDPKTMQSKLVSGLYFAGEMIDVDAYTGGFNLQIAFSTGFLAAVSDDFSDNIKSLERNV